MFLGTLITNACIAVLGGYLALSGSLAESLERSLVRFGVMESRPHLAREATEGSNTPKPPDTLPSDYETGGPIPRILLENLEYQQAAVAGAGTGRAKDPKTAAVKDALVNIFCAYRDRDKIHATTGSGIFIDDKGIILTNAHVAQFLLIGEFKDHAKCTVRQGNPATDRYLADLLYISPAWVHTNAKLIDAVSPSGTGERDYALLYVTESIRGARPEVFPALSIDTSPLLHSARHTKIAAGGYPAEIFGKDGPRAELIPRVAETTLLDLFTFGSNDADLMAVGPSSVGEQGSSGGPITSKDNKVIGLIVTKGDEKKEGVHSLRALTLPYIDRTIKEETGFDLATTLEGNIPRRAEVFKKALVPFLASLLKDELK